MLAWRERDLNISVPARSATPAEPGPVDVASYEAALRSFFRRRLGPGPEVDDLVQEALARLLASRGRRDVQFPAAYLFRIAGNLLADRRRRQDGLSSVAFDEQCLAAGMAPDQEDARHLADLQRALAAALAELPDRCREVFVMRRFRNMRTPAIAETLGISHRMVQKYLVRAMTHVYLRLRDEP